MSLMSERCYLKDVTGRMLFEDYLKDRVGEQRWWGMAGNRGLGSVRTLRRIVKKFVRGWFRGYSL